MGDGRLALGVQVVRVEPEDLGLEALDAVVVVLQVVAVHGRRGGAAVGARLPRGDVLPVGQPEQLVAAALHLLLRCHRAGSSPAGGRRRCSEPASRCRSRRRCRGRGRRRWRRCAPAGRGRGTSGAHSPASSERPPCRYRS